mgnify:CR=1 FL=1
MLENGCKDHDRQTLLHHPLAHGDKLLKFLLVDHDKPPTFSVERLSKASPRRA